MAMDMVVRYCLSAFFLFFLVGRGVLWFCIEFFVLWMFCFFGAVGGLFFIESIFSI